MLKKTTLAMASLIVLTTSAQARDFTFSNGRLTDDQFYKAITCKAAIDKPCENEPVRWPAYLSNKLTVGLALIQDGTSSQQEQIVRQALQNSIDMINASGANVTLRYVSGFGARRTWIKVHIIKPHGPRNAIKGVKMKGFDGMKAQNARTRLYVTANNQIGRVGITISNTIKDPTQIRAIVLEELVQALGLMWDIENPYYNDKSIFSQSGPDTLLKIQGQDKAALQRHYP